MAENTAPDGIYLTGWYAGNAIFADGANLAQILADPLGTQEGLGQMGKDAVTVFLARALSAPVKQEEEKEQE